MSSTEQLVLFFLVGTALSHLALADTWAVLICGSRDYTNYRHQADICHAYHTLISQGMTADHIITFVFNDAVNNSLNPYPGQLFSSPTPEGITGVDVYAGCILDYTWTDVSLANIIPVLMGNTSAVAGIGSGRVLKSTSSENVIINFVDHGAPYFVQIPNGPYWYSWQLQDTLAQMYQQKRFSKLLFYMESCQSGSMFENMTDSIPVYATTASAANESSFGIYCPPGGDFVNGVELETCLADLYQASWINFTNSPGAMQQTLHQQFIAVRAEVNLSTVEQFGDLSMADLPLEEFFTAHSLQNRASMASAAETNQPPPNPLANSQSYPGTANGSGFHLDLSPISAREMSLTKGNRGQNLIGNLADAQLQRNQTDALFLKLAGHVAELLRGSSRTPTWLLVNTLPLHHRDCYAAAVSEYEALCGKFTDYALQYAGVLLNLCEAVSGSHIDALLVVRGVCTESL